MKEDIWERITDSPEGIPPEETPPFTICFSNKYLWVLEVDLRSEFGSTLDRTIGAVLMAARLSKKEVFFVGRGARKRFGLSPNMLNKGLNRLERESVLETVESKKGRYRRIRLLPQL